MEDLRSLKPKAKGLLPWHGDHEAQAGGLENMQKRYLIHVAGFNLGLLMRKVIGSGTPKRAADGLGVAMLMVNCDSVGILVFIFLVTAHEVTVLVVAAVNFHCNKKASFSTDC